MRAERRARSTPAPRRARSAQAASPAPPEFGEGLSTVAWFSHAAAIGGALTVGGALVGALLGLLFGIEWGGIVGLCVVAIAGIVWGMLRLGGGGFGLGLVGGIAALLGAAELRYAVVAQGSIETLPSLSAWDPEAGPPRIRVAPVTTDERYAAYFSQTYRGSRGSSTTVGYQVVPWLEGSRVVGYGCVVSSRRGAAATAGSYALSVEARFGFRDEHCARGVRSSASFVQRAGLEVAPGAADRIVRVYGSEAALRGDHEAGKAFWAPAVFLAVYLAGVAVFRLVRAYQARAGRGEPGAR